MLPDFDDNEILKRLKSDISYRPEFAVRLLKHCENGGTFEGFCSQQYISPSLLQEWATDPNKPEMAEAYKLGIANQVAYLEREIDSEIQKLHEDADVFDESNFDKPDKNNVLYSFEERPKKTDKSRNKAYSEERIKMLKSRLLALGSNSKSAIEGKALFKTMPENSGSDFLREAGKRREAGIKACRDIAKELKEELISKLEKEFEI